MRYMATLLQRSVSEASTIDPSNIKNATLGLPKPLRYEPRNRPHAHQQPRAHSHRRRDLLHRLVKLVLLRVQLLAPGLAQLLVLALDGDLGITRGGAGRVSGGV